MRIIQEPNIHVQITVAAALTSVVTASPIDSKDASLAIRATGGQVGSWLNDVVYFNNANIRDGPPSSGGTQYVQYHGDGSTGQGWPGRDRWIAFEDLCVELLRIWSCWLLTSLKVQH